MKWKSNETYIEGLAALYRNEKNEKLKNKKNEGLRINEIVNPRHNHVIYLSNFFTI